MKQLAVEAGTDADDAAGRGVGRDVVGGGLGDGLFEFVLGHGVFSE